MLISFSVENWMSFRDKVKFSMIATRERQHDDRVADVETYARILPIAAIYGGNASGKTNFFMAMNFAKKLVVRGTRPESLIPVKTFLLDKDYQSRPSQFVFELCVDETMYEFSFAVTNKAVIREKLVCIKKASEKVLYNRCEGKITFDKSLSDGDFLRFAAKGTRDNQLFLTNSVSQKVEHFSPVYNWFKDTLVMIAPDARFEPFEQFFDESNPLYETMNTMLQQLDTGIDHLGADTIAFKNLLLPNSIKTRIQEDLKEENAIRIDAMNDRFIITRDQGDLVAKKLVTYHANAEGGEAKFEMQQESDGSQRIIDLLPAFVELMDSSTTKVYVIDEIDRSLHTLLTRRLLEAYLVTCSPTTRKQLLLTTHDVLLMDQRLLRRDEMWVTERGPVGESRLYSFSEFKDVRYDKDILKSYLQGRLGGIPRILLADTTSAPCIAQSDGERN